MELKRGEQEKMPGVRQGINHDFWIGDGKDDPEDPEKVKRLHLTATVSFYENGQVGELFIRADKEGSMASGLIHWASINLSVGIQRGTPLKDFIRHWRYMRFPPSGPTSNPEIPTASSVPDYLAQWLMKTVLTDMEDVPKPPVMHELNGNS
jgi:hypothetical protein